MPVTESRLPYPVTAPPLPDRDSLRLAGPLAALVISSLLAAAILTAQPAVAIAIPAVALGALACARRPAAAVTALLLLSATTNVLPSLTPIPNPLLSDFLLVGLWLGVLGTYLLGRTERGFWLWPALIGATLYLALTAVEALLVSPLSYGFKAFDAAAWSMAAALLVAVSPWSRATHRRIAKGIVVVSIAVGLYCLLRFITGPSAAEAAAASIAQVGLPPSVQARFFGSFLTANELAAWTATVIPFLLVYGLGSRGRWRLLSLAAILPLAIALFDSDVRTGILAAGAGLLVAFVLYLASPAFPGRLAAGLAAVVAVLGIGAAAYTLTVGTSAERSTRFEGILSPGEDKAFSDRRRTWDEAWQAMSEKPWGYGLGAAGGVAATNDREPVVSQILDSSYLKVGLEQGFVVMVFFAGSLVLLLGALGVRSTRVRDSQGAALMIGGCGALAASLVLFYAGLYSEGLPILAAWLIVGLGISQVTIHDAGAVRPPAPEW